MGFVGDAKDDIPVSLGAAIRGRTYPHKAYPHLPAPFQSGGEWRGLPLVGEARGSQVLYQGKPAYSLPSFPRKRE